MSSRFDHIKKFAKEAHDNAGQVGYFEDHVIHVFNLAMKNVDADYVVGAAALLHDVLEDTQVTKEEIQTRFGVSVANVVYRLTDGPGRNRAERKENTFWKIRSCRDATLIKLCDRLHNIQRGGKIDMYRKEHHTFKCALYHPHMFEDIWKEMDELLS